jgi:hypothetical protein
MTKYYLYTLLFSLFYVQSFAQRPKVVTDINNKGASFPVGVQIINTGEELLFNAYDPKKGNQLFVYDGISAERVSRFSDSYKNGRFEPEQQSKIPLGSVSSGFIKYNKTVLFSSMGELTKPSVYRYIDGGVDKLKTNLLTSNINCRVKDDLYFIGSKKITNKETNVSTWEKVFYKVEGGEHIQKLNLIDKLAPKIRCMAEANGQVYFITKKKLYRYDGNSYHSERVFEKDLLESLVSIEGKLYIWAYRKRKKSLISAETGRTITSKLIKNRDRICIEPRALSNNQSLAYLENAYSRYNDLVIANGKNFKNGDLPLGIFKNIAKVDEIESLAWFEGVLLICMKERGKNEYNLWQYGNDTLVKYRFRRINDIRSINYLKGKLYFTAKGSNKGRELYEFIPFKAPELRNQTYTIMELMGKNGSVGRVRVDKLNGKIAKFKILKGNPNDAFSIDEFTGEIRVNNASEMRFRKNPKFQLLIEVNNQHMNSNCTATITLQESKHLNRQNLLERFLFFPDFKRAKVLKTNVLSDGEVIEIYNLKLRMVDKVTVSRDEIVLGNYPPGIYYLNANNGKRNYVQKMEMK